MKKEVQPPTFLNDDRGLDFYARVPESLIYDGAAPSHAARVYGLLDRHLNHRTKTAYPGTRYIADRLNVARSHVCKCLSYLEVNNYIKIDSGGLGLPNEYRLMGLRGQDLSEVHPRSSRRSTPGPLGGPPPDLQEVHKDSLEENTKGGEKEGAGGAYPTNKDVRAFTDWWVAEFPKMFSGAPYDFKGVRDRTAALNILKLCDRCQPKVEPKSLVAFCWETYKADKFYGDAVKTIAGLHLRSNKFLPEFLKKTQGTKTRAYESEAIRG